MMKKIYAVYCNVRLTSYPGWLYEFRKKYDEMYDFHITLKQMAYIDENQLSVIKKKLDALFNKFMTDKQRIRLTFDRLVIDEGEPSEKNWYIYIFSDSNGQLNDLQQKIRIELKEFSDYCSPKSHDYEYDFKPHITIARNLDTNTLIVAASEIKDDFVCEGEVKDIILSCVKEISLKESKNPNNFTVYRY